MATLEEDLSNRYIEAQIPISNNMVQIIFMKAILAYMNRKELVELQASTSIHKPNPNLIFKWADNRSTLTLPRWTISSPSLKIYRRMVSHRELCLQVLNIKCSMELHRSMAVWLIQILYKEAQWKTPTSN